jgi:hypothetical protein
MPRGPLQPGLITSSCHYLRIHDSTWEVFASGKLGVETPPITHRDLARFHREQSKGDEGSESTLFISPVLNRDEKAKQDSEEWLSFTGPGTNMMQAYRGGAERCYVGEL